MTDEAAPPPGPMLRVGVRIASTGREFAVEVPEDMTLPELVEASAWMLTTLANHLQTRTPVITPVRSFLDPRVPLPGRR